MLTSSCLPSPSTTRSSSPASTAPRDPTPWRGPSTTVVPAHHAVEGAGFEVWRPFPGGVDAHDRRPLLPARPARPGRVRAERGHGRARGTRTAASRPSPTCIDGVIAHHDSNGGGGVIGEGDTQWMTAGSGILHDEVPTETFLRNGGRVARRAAVGEPPAALKFTPPRYQAITGDNLMLLVSPDGGALVRLIAGDLAGHAGPGRDAHADHLRARQLSPGAELAVPWNPAFNALVYVLPATATPAPSGRPIEAHQLVVFGPGDAITLGAAEHQAGRLPEPRGPAARRPPDPRADRPLRPVPDEHARRDHPGHRRLQAGRMGRSPPDLGPENPAHEQCHSGVVETPRTTHAR